MPLIACKNLTLAYEQLVVIQNLNFEVNHGEYLCIVGENGSGKSTLVKALLHLKKPAGGQIVTGESLKTGLIGYLPQQSAIQRDFPANVQEVVLSGRQNIANPKLFYTTADKQIAEQNMQLLGIAHLARRCYRELSGGQQQRVLLARALCATQALLILDEPVAGLDPAATKDLYTAIQNLNREQGLTIIMVSHDIGAAVTYASHILQLGGKTPFFGTKEEYKRSPIAKRLLGEKEGNE